VAWAWSLATAARASKSLVAASLFEVAEIARAGCTASAGGGGRFRKGIASSPMDRISNHSGESLMPLAPTVHPYF